MAPGNKLVSCCLPRTNRKSETTFPRALLLRLLHEGVYNAMVSIKCCGTLRLARLSSLAKVSGSWVGIASCTVGSPRSTPPLRRMQWHVDPRKTHLAVSLGIFQFDHECGFRPPPRLAARWRSSAPSLQVPLSFRGQGGHPGRCVSRALASCRRHQLQPPQRSAALPKTQRQTFRSSPATPASRPPTCAEMTFPSDKSSANIAIGVRLLGFAVLDTSGKDSAGCPATLCRSNADMVHVWRAPNSDLSESSETTYSHQHVMRQQQNQRNVR